jgi:hypothetical protein
MAGSDLRDLTTRLQRVRIRGDVGTRILIFFALDPKLVPKPEV